MVIQGTAGLSLAASKAYTVVSVDDMYILFRCQVVCCYLILWMPTLPKKFEIVHGINGNVSCVIHTLYRSWYRM